MSKNPEPAERDTLRTCSTRALNALGTLKHAIATFRQLSEPKDITERDLRDEISKNLKQVHLEIMAVLFATSMLVDSTVPQVPRIH